MVKTFSFLFLFLFLASCGGGGGGGSKGAEVANETVSSEVTETAEDTAKDPVASTAAQTFEVNADLTGFSSSHEEKVMKAIEIIKQVVASDEFKKQVLNKKYNGKKTFVDNGGYTNAQIYKKILEGSEKLTPGKNNAMDLKLETYYADAIVIGYTMASIKTIYMNRKYLAQFEANQVAMNLFHEWLHKLGFGHAADNSASRPHSVPYAIGYIVRDLAKNYM